MTVVPLRSRERWTLILALVVAVVLGGVVSACALVAVIQAPFGNAWDVVLYAIPVLALLPVAWLVRRLAELRPARIVLGAASLAIEYPELLREPLVVPRTELRVIAIDDRGRARFRVDVEEEGYLWTSSATTLPALPPHIPPNLALLFRSTLPAVAVRRSPLKGLLAGERPAGLLLRACDVRQAEAALAPLGVTRQITLLDTLVVDMHLHEREGGRAALVRRRENRSAWLGGIVGVLFALHLLWATGVL